VLKGFKNFLMQGELVVIAVGLVVALAFSTLIKAFTDNIITPLVNAIAGGGSTGKGIGWTLNGQRINVGAFIGAVIYFVILIAVIYYLIVVPYRSYMKKRGRSVFGDQPPTRTLPQLPVGRYSRGRHQVQVLRQRTDRGRLNARPAMAAAQARRRWLAAGTQEG
jgi:large conductance mechanosensitive channel